MSITVTNGDIGGMLGSKDFCLCGNGESHGDAALTSKEIYRENLKGLTVSAIGDSYFAGHTLGGERVWVQLLANKYEWNFTNCGKNGGVVACYDPNEDDTPMCIRYPQMPDNNPDIVLVDGGRNDFKKNTPMGTYDGDDLNNFATALDRVIGGLKKKYPNTAIICTTVWNFAGVNQVGLTSADYAAAMRDTAERHEVYCFFAHDSAISGVDMTDDSFRAEYCLRPEDVSHLNEIGMRNIMPRFERFIADCYENYKEKNNIV